MPSCEEVGAAADEVEAELRRLGWWSSEPPAAPAFQFEQAFAMDTMAFSQWLQWVFLPRVRELVASDGPWPESSMVAVQAVREFDGDASAEGLHDALRRFDDLF